MRFADIEALALPLVASDRENTLLELREEISNLKGDAVGRGRLRAGFFVGDLRRLCEKFLDRRAQAILAAYESVMAVASADIVPYSEVAVQSMLDQLSVDVETIEQEFQSNLHRDHLPVPSAMAPAESCCAELIKARGSVLVRKCSQRELLQSPASAGMERMANQEREEDIVELNPNLWGFGLNIRALERRIRRWWRERRSVILK